MSITTAKETPAPQAPPQTHVRRPAWTKRRQTLVALFLYVALALATTWPWVIHPSDVLYGIQGADLTANLAYYEHAGRDLQPPFLPGRLSDIDAPEGLETTWALNLAGLGSSATYFVLSAAVGSVAAHGLMAVMGFALSAFAMFLLVRRYTGHFPAALLAGLAWGFWPYTYVTGWTWPHYIQGWVFVLLLWRMLEVSERPTLRNGLLAGAAAAVAMTWIQYNLLIAGVLFAALAVAVLVRARWTGTLARQVRAQAAASAVVVVTAVAVFAAAEAQDFSGLPTRSGNDAITNSARPLMYLLPGPNHRLFGDSIGGWVNRKYVGPSYDPESTASYATIYLGIPLMLLAIVGLVVGVRELLRGRAGPRDPRTLWLAACAAFFGLVGLVFSAPPQFEAFGRSFPLPYTLINEVTPVFRVAHRFALLAMLAACLLAAVGVAALLRGRSAAVTAVATVAIGFVLLVDLSAIPVQRVTDIAHPAAYDVLKKQPDGIVAEYPFRDTGWMQAVESFHQPAHEKGMFTGWDRGTDTESKKLELQYLTEPRTIPDLARYGVDYVVIHDAGSGHPPWVPQPGARVPGLELLTNVDGSAVYRITAKPSRFTTYAWYEFNAPEGEPPGVVRWQRSNGARIDVLGSCDPCEGTLEFESASFGRPRKLTLSDPSGRVLHEQTLDSEVKKLRVPLRFSNETHVSLATDPPPDQINKIMGGEDTRTFGVLVAKRRFRPR